MSSSFPIDPSASGNGPVSRPDSVSRNDPGSSETPNPAPARGRLKVFLGYAAGVGKTFKMLHEAQERKRGGCDVVVGYFEPHGRSDTIAQLEGLEVIPRRSIEYRGTNFE